MIDESRYLAFSGLRVHFDLVRPEAPIRSRIMFLSSPLTNTFNWRKLLPELEGLGCLVVLADLPGFGRSDLNAPQEPTARANLLWGVLDDVDRTLGDDLATWHLAAHGLACSTLLRMAELYPDSVRSQIHFAPVFSADVTGRESPERWFDSHILDPRRFHSLIEHYSGYPMDDYVVDRMRAPFQRSGARRDFVRMLRQFRRSPGRATPLCPTMALYGGRDPLIGPEGEATLRRVLPEAEFHRISNAGHFPMETHSKAMRDYLRGWLRYNDI